MAKKTPKSLPPVGGVYAFQLPNGLYSVFRILNSKRMHGPKYVLAACSPFITKELPTGVTPEMKLTLRPTHHNRSGRDRSLYWISAPLDGDVVFLGSVPPSTAEGRLDPHSYGHWLNLKSDALTQWRWEHDRDQLLADEAAEKRAKEERRNQTHATNKAKQKSMTLEKLTEYRFLADWDDYPPAKVTAASRRLLKGHVAKLIALGKQATSPRKAAVIRSCVEGFNALNAKHDDFIDTDCREAILAEIGRLSQASGLGEMADEIDEWRDW